MATTSIPKMAGRGPLTGIKIIELGHFIAGPYAGTILGYFGAEVIKIEPMGDGDQIRKFRTVDETGTSYWHYSLNRNKRSVSLDLKQPQGQAIVRDLAAKADVVIENFRPGQMEKWNIGPEDLKRLNPSLIYSAISGYGRTGPYANKAGFASVCEAMGGFRYVNGFPDMPSVRPNLSMGDTLAGMNAALGTLLALYERDGHGGPKKGSGQLVDTAIYESVFGIMEGVLCDYSGAGEIRQPSGSTLTGIVPTNTYRTKDDKYVVIGANSDALFKRLFKLIGREDIGEDPEYRDNQQRSKHQKFLDDEIERWTKRHTASEVVEKVTQVQVPNGLIYSIKDIVEDPQYRAREQLEKVDIPGTKKELLIPAIGSKLSETPGRTHFPGERLGESTAYVLKQVLGYDDARYAELKKNKVIQD